MNKQGNTLVVIGAGAAGIFCAVNAARLNKNLSVIVLEKSAHVLSKVIISGGGRCNLTHHHDSISTMSKCYPRGEKFVKQTFHHFFTKDTIQWFADRNVPTKVEADGRMFPVSNTSESIINCLLTEAKKYNVEIRIQTSVSTIHPPTNANALFELDLQNGQKQSCNYLLIACGGFPKLSQFDWITKLGHSVSEPIPSLFTFNLQKSAQTHLPKLIDLMGVVATNATVKIVGSKHLANGPVLITHWGISGPAVLTLSAFAAKHLHGVNYIYDVQINWNGNYNETSALEKIRLERNELLKQVGSKNPFDLPVRLWEYLLKESAIEPTQKWSTLNAKQQNMLAKQICSFLFNANGKTTFKEEFVTAGGVTLSEINPARCESKLIKNLFFAGEILDVDGKTGGFNFQHAWTSGWIVAKAIAEE